MATHRYSVFGACLDSEVVIPEMPASALAHARWRFRQVAELPPIAARRELGSEQLYADVHARLIEHADGHRIEVDDTGCFDVSADRQTIVFAARDGAWPDFVRAHLLGRVLGTALYLDGLLPLHASAVETPEGVVAFLAPKGFGKSTLALALVAAGAPLGTDDTLPVEPGAPVMAWPGVHSIRVHADAMAAVGPAATPAMETREGKLVVNHWGPGRVQDRRAPLAAIYVLDPSPPDAGVALRTALPSTIAAIGVVAHIKVGRMLGPTAAAAMLARAADIVARVPVHRLHAPRDLARLPETAAIVLGWHGRAAP